MFDTVRARPVNAILPGDVPLTLPLLARTCLLPPPATDDFTAALMPHLTAGPWADSFAVAPGETAGAVAHALRDVMVATATLRPEAVDVSALDPASRVHRHLAALRELWVALGDRLPPDLAILRGVLEAGADDIVDPLYVIHDGEEAGFSLIERTVIATLTARHGLPPDIAARRAEFVAARDACHGVPGSALRHMQDSLLSPSAVPVPRDDSVRMFGLRDAEAEAHVAASLAQRLLDTEPDLSPADIGLLLPAGPEHIPFVREAFARAGLPLSGLPAGLDARDLAGECLLHLLTCLRPLGPAMARASLLRLPLMPWSAKASRRLSQAVMDGRRLSSAATSLDDDGREILKLLESPPSHPHVLADVLESLPSHLSRAPDVAEDVAAFCDLAGDLAAVLRAQPNAEIAWEDLATRIPVASAKAGAPGPALLDAVTVLVDGERPQRPIRHLMVLGFSEGAFPVSPGINPMFLDSEIETIRRCCGLDLPSRQALLSRRLDVFRRQLMAASRSLTVLVPCRDLLGTAIAPSASLNLMARCLSGFEDPDRLIVDLSGAAPDDTPPCTPETKSLPLAPLAVPASLDLGRNLLALRHDAEGRMRDQSPSRLDTLLVSPLAWLLNELGLVACLWEPEGLGVLTIGTLFHTMAEALFPPDAPLPEEAAIAARLPDLLTQEIRKTAPFLMAAPWMVERRRLEAEFTTVLVAWRRTLVALGAEIVANELPLRGEVLGIPCRGFADSLLRLPDDSLLIVDHKTSAASTRRRRMEKGWDLQVEIYRALAHQTAGDPELETNGLVNGHPIAVAYHTTRDGTLLFHGPAPACTAPGVEIVDADIGIEALGRLRAELRALSTGRLNLPERIVLDQMAKEGVRPYALDKSPLAASFVRDDDVEDDDDA
jgi:RecB family exonuclease